MRTPPWVFQSRRLAGAAALTLGLAAAAVAVAGPGGTASAAIKPPCCRVLSQPAAVGWGLNFDGQLGDGQSSQNAVPNWAAVAGLSGVAQVSAGSYDSLALTSDGRVWAWGITNLASLDEPAADSDVPVPVPGLAGITQVAAGQETGLALRSDGTVWAWGYNDFGQLGTGSDAPSFTPVQVSGLTGVTQIAAGYGWSMALRSDGTVWSWGVNVAGQLGDGTGVNSNVPVQVKGLSHVTRIAAGSADGLAVAAVARRGIVTTLSTVYAWGANSDGQVGDGTTQERFAPVPVTGVSVPSVAGIAMGDDFAMVLGTDGTVWDWGQNGVGQLGNGTTTAASRPVEARGPGSGIVQIAAGSVFALARRSDGTVWAWGFNEHGELGDGTTTGLQANPAPVQVTALSGATSIAAGNFHALAIRQPPLVSLP
jgi:alpha-tubulin suppressor-like RCC1 family protein